MTWSSSGATDQDGIARESVIAEPAGSALPDYTRLRQTPSIEIPEGLKEAENHPQFLDLRGRIQSDLVSKLSADPTAKLFFEFADDKGNPLTIETDQGRSLLAFSHPFKAFDYARALGLPSQFVLVSSTAEDLIRLFRMLEDADVRAFTIDRCPRCSIFTSLGTDSVPSPDRATGALAIFKATEMARSKLYSDFAIMSALEERFESARDVALEAVGHVTPLATDHHIVVGQCAIMLDDSVLFDEAVDYLEFLQHSDAVALLQTVRDTKTPQFPRPRPRS